MYCVKPGSLSGPTATSGTRYSNSFKPYRSTSDAVGNDVFRERLAASYNLRLSVSLSY
jgi:hypothetical protein